MNHRLHLRSPRRSEQSGVPRRGIMELQKNFSEQLVTDGIGEQIFALAAKLYPICRSITGDGVRETLREIGTHIDLHVREVADRYAGLRLDYPAGVEHSRRVHQGCARRKDRRLCPIEPPCDELQRSRADSGSHWPSSKSIVYTLPDQPELIPYRTSYYAENWAFCMSHRQFESLRDEIYEVVIDSTLEARIAYLRRISAQR